METENDCYTKDSNYVSAKPDNHITSSISAVTFLTKTMKRSRWTEEEQRAYWQVKKEEKKKRKREANAARRKSEEEEWERLSPEEQEHRRLEAVQIHEKRRNAESMQKIQCELNLKNEHKPILVFDLSFAWCMSLADTKSTISQIKLSYSALKRNSFPFRPVITSLVGYELKEAEVESTERVSSGTATDNEPIYNNMACAMNCKLADNNESKRVIKDAVTMCELHHQNEVSEEQQCVLQSLQTFDGFRAFPITITESQHWSSLYERSNVIVLSADADDVLESIEDDTVYVVGAFVDHNQHKNLTRNAASHHGARSARLPLQEYIKLGNRCKVLTINHVVEVLVRYMSNGKNWTDAFAHVLPTRRVEREWKELEQEHT